MPRWIPGGPRNAVRVRRLKDKLGNRSNASAEVEFEDAWGVMVGEPGRGLSVLLEMAATTRLDCVLGSAALLRQALVQAAHHARHRQAFGKPLAEQPLMRNVLADLALESEASMALALRLARAVDERADPARGRWRAWHAGAKLWVCKRAVAAVAECLEAWGGNGYVEDGPMPRLYRETPVNSVWEGSGNVMALDVLRALQREPEGMPALARELDAAAGQYRDYDAALAQWRASLADPAQAEVQARRIAAGLARLAGGAVDPARAGRRRGRLRGQPAGGGRRHFRRIARRRRCPRHPGARLAGRRRMLNFPTSYRLTHLERHAFPARTQAAGRRRGLEFVEQVAGPDAIIGVGTAPPPTSSSTAGPFQGRIAGTWPARAQRARLAGHGLKVLDLNDARHADLRGRRRRDQRRPAHDQGGGGADAREDRRLGGRALHLHRRRIQAGPDAGQVPLPLEVIPMARESVARAMAALGGQPRLREGFVTDNGNIILDVSGLSITDAPALEARVNNLPGVVTCGLFALPGADVALLATQNGIRRLDRA